MVEEEATLEAPEEVSGSLTDNVREYIKVWNELQEIEREAKKRRERLAFFEPIIADEMKEQGVSKLSLDDRTISVRVEHYMNIAEGKRPAAIAALRDAGMEDLITVNWQGFTPRLKELMGGVIDTSKLPEALQPLIVVHERTKLGNTKASR